MSKSALNSFKREITFWRIKFLNSAKHLVNEFRCVKVIMLLQNFGKKIDKRRLHLSELQNGTMKIRLVFDLRFVVEDTIVWFSFISFKIMQLYTLKVKIENLIRKRWKKDISFSGDKMTSCWLKSLLYSSILNKLKIQKL